MVNYSNMSQSTVKMMIAVTDFVEIRVEERHGHGEIRNARSHGGGWKVNRQGTYYVFLSCI